MENGIFFFSSSNQLWFKLRAMINLLWIVVLMSALSQVCATHWLVWDLCTGLYFNIVLKVFCMFLISDLYSYISGVILGVHRKLYEVMFLMSYPSTISLVLSCLWDSLFGASAKELETSLYYVLPINYTHV